MNFYDQALLQIYYVIIKRNHGKIFNNVEISAKFYVKIIISKSSVFDLNIYAHILIEYTEKTASGGKRIGSELGKSFFNWIIFKMSYR